MAFDERQRKHVPSRGEPLDRPHRLDASGACFACSVPHLGLATTEALIVELAARVDVAVTIGEAWPHYRTAGGEDG